ncbi:MAG TPA: FG-GAP-like repeat-containing protein [Candidatus Sulfotelmatobacter sp.]|nr:FG-GAP-like repeat-containing protein [Candidatus Sulfotelmatobacter sp.]
MRVRTIVLLSTWFTLLFVAVIAATTSSHAETFKNPRLIRTGSDPTELAEGDFNRDGKQDLVYEDGSGLHVLLGNGDGTFAKGQNIALPSGFSGKITVADVNADGNPDLIIGGSSPQAQIGVLLGNGDGTFKPMIVSQFAARGSAWPDLRFTFGVADVNGDGATDLIVGDPANNYLYVLLGDNSGSFTLKTTISSGSPGDVITGDFNGDGHQDFLVHDILGAGVTVYLGNGDGTFQTGVGYTGPHNITSVLLADMDGDGHPDMVVTGFNNTIDILHGNADGTFATTSSGGSSNGGPAPSLIAVADLNGDGTLDIATACGNGICILLGKGNLTYGNPVPFSAGPASTAAVAADFNSDGHMDFAITAPDGIALLLGNGDGTLQTADNYDLGEAVSGVAVADFNSDKISDIGVSVSEPNPRILLGTGGGRFTVTADTNQSSNGNGAQSILTGDFNGDGKPDIFLGGNGTSGTVSFGNGNGTFSAPVPLSEFTAIGFDSPTVADFNKDGKSDLAVANYQSVDVLLGQSNNSFSLMSSIPDVYLTATAVPATGDFNNDGKLDMVVGNVGYENGLQILLGNGDGTFQLGRFLSTELLNYTNLNAPTAIATADLDGDGNVDIVALISFPQVAEIFYGNGDGTFQSPVVLPLARSYTQMAIADMNGDGRPDLVLSDGSVICIIHNNGSRTFGPEVHYLAGGIRSFVVQDVNGDGLPDIVVANSGVFSGGAATTVTVLLSQAGGAAVSGTLAVSPQPDTIGSPFTMTLTLAAGPGGSGIPTGTVQFSIDGNPITTVPVSGSTVSFTETGTSALGLGQHAISADYSGDLQFLPSEFTAQENIVPVIHSTTIALTAKPTSVTASQTVSFHAMVTSAGLMPTGTVGFYDGSTTIGSSRLNGSGLAVFDTALLSPGTHSVTAAYFGDTNSGPSTSSPVTITVNAFSTTTTVSAMPSTIQTGAISALSATVISSSGTPSGGVTFFDGTGALATQPLDANGNAVYGAVFSTPGTHTITASYNANAEYASSTSQVVNVTVTGTSAAISTTNVLVITAQPHGETGPTFSATVKALKGMPSGKVLFLDGTMQIGEAVIGPTGVATFVSPLLSPGMHYVTGFYPGNSEFGPSMSSAVNADMPTSLPDFSLTLSPAEATIVRGQSAVVGISLSAVNKFSAQVSLSCSSDVHNLPCSVQPESISGNGGTARLVLQTHGRNSASSFWDVGEIAQKGSSGLRLILLFVCALIIARRFAGTRSLRARQMLCFVCLIGAGILGGCALARPSLPPSAAGTYIVTVTATSRYAGAFVTHSAQVKATITPD